MLYNRIISIELNGGNYEKDRQVIVWNAAVLIWSNGDSAALRLWISPYDTRNDVIDHRVDAYRNVYMDYGIRA